jgi:hypothetical protein
MKITIDEFAGQYPRLAASALPDSGAQIAANVRLTSKSLRSLNSSSPVSATLPAGTQSIYSLGAYGSSVILAWNTDVDVAPSPIADSEYKVYYTDGGDPKKTSLALATSGAAPYPANWYYLGVPAPTTAPTLASSTTTTNLASGTYAYVFTYVTKFGTTLTEESGPSPAQLITLASPGQVTLTFPTAPSTTNRNYQYINVYRSTSGAYVLVAQIPFSSTTFTDNISAANIPGTALPSLGWLPPPTGLLGICALPSGVLVGFIGNQIWFSEPGYPHAWPLKYMQAFDAPIVAIKTFGNNVAVATAKYPYVGTGVYPSTFTFQRLPMLEPCVSKRSMAADEEGAVYASNNGLVSIGLDSMQILTAAELTRQEMANYNPSVMLGAIFERRYYGFTTVYGSSGSVQRALIVGRGEDIVGLRTLELGATAVTLEPTSAQLFYVGATDNLLYSVDPVGTVPLTYVWKSKRYELPYPTNFSCFQVHAAEISPTQAAANAAIAAANAAIATSNATVFATGVLNSEVNALEINAQEVNGSAMQSLIPSVSPQVTLAVYASGQVIYSNSVNVNTVYRLPSGFKALNWEVQFTGQTELTRFEMASSIQELKKS